MKALIGTLILASLLGCRPNLPPPVEPTSAIPVQFTDVTRESGIDFIHENGAEGMMYLPETMGSGCAFIDYDSDGWMDILALNGMYWSALRRKQPTMRLYRNEQRGRFSDVTAEVGLDVPIYGMGVTAGDFDNDGFDDVFITAVGKSRLFKNVRDSKRASREFLDVTADSGITDSGWSTSATWVDYDRDGLLDLFVCHYVQWTPTSNRVTSFGGDSPTYSTPEQYAGESCRLYRNEGTGRFRDVTQATGIYSARSKALGVVALDFDDDGWQDIAVANDTEPNFLFHNQTDGTFKEVALEMGMAVSDLGRPKAGMGIDAADEMNDGAESLAITNFSGEQLTLFRRAPGGSFIDAAAQSGIGAATQMYLGFGVCFMDYDLDGRQDLFVSNGHIQGDVAARQTGVLYREPALLLRHQGNGRFAESTSSAGTAMSSPMIGRGAAWGDYDNDGDPDLLVTSNRGDKSGTDGLPRLLRNDGKTGNRWLRVILKGTTDNRNGFGSKVRLRTSSGIQTRTLRAGSSYLSQSDSRLLLGLGKNDRIEAVEVQWPSGQLQTVTDVGSNRTVTIRQSVAIP